jgi:acetyl esterase/lipase
VLAGILRTGVQAADAPHTEPAAPAAKTFDVQVVRNLVYRDLAAGEDAKRDKNKLDLYLPKGQKDFPVLFFVHGGAWRHGDKNHRFGLYSNFATDWAQHGIGTVVTNYRLSPGVKHPEHMKDVAKAFAWTVKNISRYGGRPDQIFVSGHSAGGHLVALLATDESYLKVEGLSLQAIKGAIPISGVYRVHDIHLDEAELHTLGDKATATLRLQAGMSLLTPVFGTDPRVLRNASPLSHVQAGLPPFLLIYADKDLMLLPAMAREFGSHLKENKCEVHTLEVKERNHRTVLARATRDDDPAVLAMWDFIIQHKATGPTKGVAPGKP